MKKKATKKKATKKVAKKKPVGYQGFKGTKTKMSVATFWVYLFARQAKARLTDPQIVSAMRSEFKDSKAYTRHDVVMFRNRYNNGKLGEQSSAPKVKCGEYVSCPHCKKGVRLPMWGEKSPGKPKSTQVTKKKATKKKSKKKATKKKKITKVPSSAKASKRK